MPIETRQSMIGGSAEVFHGRWGAIWNASAGCAHTAEPDEADAGNKKEHGRKRGNEHPLPAKRAERNAERTGGDIRTCGKRIARTVAQGSYRTAYMEQRVAQPEQDHGG